MNQEGIALIFTLIVIALLSILIIEASFLSMVDASIVGNWENERGAYYLAKGGVSFGIHMLRKDGPGVDSHLEDWAGPIPPLPVDEGVIELTISDEDGKININKLIDKHGKLNPELVAVVSRLFRDFDIDSETVSSLLARMDGDSSARPGSSEKGSKNRLFDTKGELAMFPELESCIDLLTVYSSGKININTAPASVLESLSAGIDAKIARAIIDYRNKTVFRTVAQLAEVPGITPAIVKEVTKVGTIKSKFFTVVSVGSMGESRKAIVCVVERTKKGLDMVYWKSGSPYDIVDSGAIAQDT